MATATTAPANDVWVDFTSDFHDGNGGQNPNGVADWIDELNDATSDARVADFTAAERAQIEANIIANLEIIYAGYQINFITNRPVGQHDVIYMARDNDLNDIASDNLGAAPIDPGNQDTNTYSEQNGNPAGVAKVTTGNFGYFMERSDSRARQILEFSTALSGTVGHELGHTFGLLHQYAYSAEGITPANYNNTGGLQLQHLMATGSTGTNESVRETMRTLSPFSRVMLDIAGGSNASTFEENNALVLNPIISDRTEEQGADAGGSIMDAMPLAFKLGETSGQAISFIEADLDFSSSDIDVFSFTTAVDSLMSAHVFSENLDLGFIEFDPVLELLDSSGSVIFSVDDTSWDDNVYNDLVSPEGEDDDPFLVNIPLQPGSYFLRVFPTTVDISDTPNPGDQYWLVTALDFELPAIAGDYNNDGVVDLADYTVWRDSLGAVGLGLFADGDLSGVVDVNDYLVWSENYGSAMSLLTASNIDRPIPEPLAITLLATGMLASLRRPQRPCDGTS